MNRCIKSFAKIKNPLIIRRKLLNLGIENNFVNLITGIFKNQTISIVINKEILEHYI